MNAESKLANQERSKSCSKLELFQDIDFWKVLPNEVTG